MYIQDSYFQQHKNGLDMEYTPTDKYTFQIKYNIITGGIHCNISVNPTYQVEHKTPVL